MEETAQTLDRGLRLLQHVADAPSGLTVTEAATRLGLGRTVVYRLAATLAAHGMLRRAADGRLTLGVGVLSLARRARPLLADAALPALRALAEQVGATTHLTIAEGGEALAVAVVEPSWTRFHVAYRTGSRHPLRRGAAGRAILAALAAEGADSPAEGAGSPEGADSAAGGTHSAAGGTLSAVEGPDGAERGPSSPGGGWLCSDGELEAGAHGIAAPVLGVPGLAASVGVVALAPLDESRAGPAVVRAAAAVAEALGARHAAPGPD